MQVRLQPPRMSEASVSFSKEDGLIVEPRFYLKMGSPPVAIIVVLDSKSAEIGRYIVKINTSGDLRLLKLQEVDPESSESLPEEPVD